MRYRTWTSGGGWSGELSGPDLGAIPNAMTLASDSSTNTIMLAVQDSANDLNFVPWLGTAWGTQAELETDTGETATQPFVFLWDRFVNVPPVITSNGGGATASIDVAENATAVTTVAATDGNLPAQTLTYTIVGGADAALFTIHSCTGVLSFIAAPDYETPRDAGADNVYNVTVQVSDGAAATRRRSA